MHKTYTAKEFLTLLQEYRYAVMAAFASKESCIFINAKSKDIKIEMVGDTARLFLNGRNPLEKNFIIVGNKYECTVLSMGEKLKIVFQTEEMSLPFEITCF